MTGTLLACGGGTASAADFLPAVDHQVGGQIYDTAAGDLNRDGRLDVVTVEQNMDRASILLGNGAGALAAPSHLATLHRPYAVTVADLDGDGWLDLAVANLGADAVSVHRGLGNGRFGSPRSFATGLAPTDVEAADLDGDAILDLALVNNGWPSSSVSVLLGRGDGSFAPALDAPVGGNYPQKLSFADLDRDGRLDIFASVANANGVAFLRGHGDGRFSAPTLYAPSGGIWGPIGITTGDFNRDGIVDVAATGRDRLWAWTGRADSTLGTPTMAITYPGGRLAGARDIATADFDGDGWLDLAVANQGSTDDAPSNVTVMHGRGDGSFGEPVPHAIPPTTDSESTREYGAGANSLALGDFNGDRRPDLAVGHMLVNHDPGGVSLLMNAGSWDPAGQAPPPPGPHPPGAPPASKPHPATAPPAHSTPPPKQARRAPRLHMPKLRVGHRKVRRAAKQRSAAKQRRLAQKRLQRSRRR